MSDFQDGGRHAELNRKFSNCKLSLMEYETFVICLGETALVVNDNVKNFSVSSFFKISTFGLCFSFPFSLRCVVKFSDV